jgi:hypothetical protein
MATEFFGMVLQAHGSHDLPYSLSLAGTLNLTQAALSSFHEGKTCVYVKVSSRRPRIGHI